VVLDFTEQQPERRRTDRGDERADRDADQQRAGLPSLPRAHGREHEHGQQRPDRIDERTFPLEQRPNVAPRTDEGEEGQDDRRPRDNENRADDERDPAVDAFVEQQHDAGDREPREQRSERDEPDHDSAESGIEFTERKPQPGLE